MGLPVPDRVVFLDMSPAVADQLIAVRAAATGQAKDIHEQDTGYLHRCYRAYAELAGRYGWSKVKCDAQGQPRSIEAIHTEVYQAVREIL